MEHNKKLLLLLLLIFNLALLEFFSYGITRVLPPLFRPTYKNLAHKINFEDYKTFLWSRYDEKVGWVNPKNEKRTVTNCLGEDVKYTYDELRRDKSSGCSFNRRLAN